jgi:hypothetical protein
MSAASGMKIKEKQEKPMDEKNDKLSMAKKIARGKIEFIRHFIVYIAVMAVLAIINNLVDRGGYQWWRWPAIFWGIGVFINFLVVYVFKGAGLKKLEQEMIRKEMERMDDGKQS